MLKLSGVSVAYGSYLALQDIHLEVAPGELVVLLGANGAGKSTLFKTISGLLKPVRGTIEFKGRNITRLPPHKTVALGLAHCLEGRALFPEMTVYKNLWLGAYTRRRDKQGFRKRLAWVYELFPVLREKEMVPVGALSGGQQQMVAIARALLSEPDLLLLDDPSSGLAPLVVQPVFQTIKTINEAGTTILLAEQNAHQALQIAHRGYVLANGRVVLADTSERLASHEGVKKAYIG